MPGHGRGPRQGTRKQKRGCTKHIDIMDSFIHLFHSLEEGALEGAAFHFACSADAGKTVACKGASVVCHGNTPARIAEDRWEQGGGDTSGLGMYELGAFGRTFCHLDADHLRILLENTTLSLWEHVPRNTARVKAFVVFGGKTFVPPNIYGDVFRDTVNAMLLKLEELWGRENLLFCAMQYDVEGAEGTEHRVEVRFDHLLPPSTLPAFWATMRAEWPCDIAAQFVEPFPCVQGASWTLPETAEICTNGIDDPEFWHIRSPLVCSEEDAEGDGEEGEGEEIHAAPEETAIPQEWNRFCNEWFGVAPLTLSVEPITRGKSDMLYYPTLVPDCLEVTSNIFRCEQGHPATLTLSLGDESLMLTCTEGCVPAGTFLKAMKKSAVQSRGPSDIAKKYETALDVFVLHFGKERKLGEMLQRHALVGDKIYSKTHGKKATYHSEEEKVTKGLYRSQYYFAIEKRNHGGQEAEEDDEGEYRFHKIQSCEKLFQNDFQHHPDKAAAIGTFFQPLTYTAMIEEQAADPDPYRFRIDCGKLNSFCTPPPMRITDSEIQEADITDAEFVMSAWESALAPEDFDHFLSWVCYLLRYGRTFVLCAFMGDEGSGKSAIMASIGAFWKPHVVTASKKKVVEEMYNSHLVTAIVLLVDDVKAISREDIYSLVTADEISERKMRTDRAQKGLHCSVMAAFNKDDNPFPLSGSGEEQRRYLLLDVNNDHINDIPHWKRVYQAIEKPAVMRHLAKTILQREDNFQRGHAKETRALQRLRIESLPTVSWLGDFLCEQHYITVQDLSGENVPRTATAHSKKENHWHVWAHWDREKQAQSKLLSESQLFRFYADLTEDGTARKPFYALLKKVLRPKTRRQGDVICVETDTWLHCVRRFLNMYPHEGLTALTAGTVPTLMRGDGDGEFTREEGGGQEDRE